MNYEIGKIIRRVVFLVPLLAMASLVCAQATFVSATHVTPSQQEIEVKFNAGIDFSGSSTGWTVTVNGIVVPVVGLPSSGSYSVHLNFDASAVAGHGTGFPFLLPGEVLRVGYDGTGGVTSASGVKPFDGQQSLNDHVFSCGTDIAFFSDSDILPKDECSPVIMDFHQFQFSVSLCMRNSSKFVTGLDGSGRTIDTAFYYYMTWGDLPSGDSGGNNERPYLSDRTGNPNSSFVDIDGGLNGYPSVIFTSRPTHHYPASSPDGCAFTQKVTPFWDGVATCVNMSQNHTFHNYDNYNGNSGVINLPPSIAGADSIALGSNVNMKFSDMTVMNCPIPPEDSLHSIKYIRVKYGSTNFTSPGNIPDISVTPPAAFGGSITQITNDDATGSFISANWYPTGAGGIGIPDLNGAIRLPTSVTVPTLTTYMGTITTAHTDMQAFGQRFYVQLDFWDLCNPYNPASPNDPAPVSIQSFIQIGGDVVAAIPKEQLSFDPFPNPNSGTFYLSNKPDHVEIFDMTGRRIAFSKEVSEDHVKLKIINPTPGINVLKSFYAGKVVTHKIMVLP